MADDAARTLAATGYVFGAVTTAFYETVKELRRSQPAGELDEHLNRLETRLLRHIRNDPTVERFPEADQLFIVEKATELVTAVFSVARETR